MGMAVAGMLLIVGAAPLYAVAGAAYVCTGIAVCAAPYVDGERIMVVTGAATDVVGPGENVVVCGSAGVGTVGHQFLAEQLKDLCDARGIAQS